MSHEVETMAYTNEVPWHGLGFNVEKAPSVPKMLKAAKLDWAVEKRPLFTHNASGEDITLDKHFALTRDSDDKVLDVVGRQYTPIQNADAFEFFKEFVEAGSAHMETAGSLRGGQMVWGLANLNAGFKLKGNDEVKGYLLVMAPHVAGKSFLVKFTTVRVVCNNTLTLALRDKGSEFRMPHRKAFDADMVEKAKEALGIARDQVSEFHENAKKLQKMKVSEKEAISFLAPIYQPEYLKATDELSPRMKVLLDVMNNAPGAQPDNAWGVLNAVTYYADHVASRTPDKRLTNAWIGRTANQKEKVLASLLDAA